MYMYLYVCMYFWIDYKFIFFYEASLSSHEGGGGTHSPSGQSIGGGQLCEGGGTHSPGGQSIGGAQSCEGGGTHSPDG